MSESGRLSSIQLKLAHQLSNRHTKDQLVQLGVMKEETIAPALQSTLQKYQKAKMEDVLNRKLSSRPSKERLLQLGVLKDDGLSPKMVEKKHTLEKARMEDMLSRKLANRPTKEDLENKNVLKTESQDQTEREQIELNLEKFLANKYSRRFSSGQVGEAIPMVNWVDDLLADYLSDTDSPRSSSEALRSEENSKEDVTEVKAKTSLKKPAPIERELSMQSIQHKKSYISNLMSKGRFVCRNCCSEFFEGVEMASPRYSYNNFFHEEDWKDLPLKEPVHHPDAKKSNLCNMCFGVCSCGIPLAADTCDNCGSLKPMTQGILWRAPENPRPKTMEDWQEMRKEQLTHYERNNDAPAVVREPKALKYSPEDEFEYFERYRFRNTLTDEGIFLEECEEADFGVLFSIEGDDDQIYEVERETEGFFYLKPDSAGNLFVVAVSDEDKTAKNSTRIYLHDPAKNWYYYGDSSAGKIFCWDPSTDTVRPVGS